MQFLLQIAAFFSAIALGTLHPAQLQSDFVPSRSAGPPTTLASASRQVESMREQLADGLQFLASGLASDDPERVLAMHETLVAMRGMLERSNASLQKVRANLEEGAPLRVEHDLLMIHYNHDASSTLFQGLLRQGRTQVNLAAQPSLERERRWSEVEPRIETLVNEPARIGGESLFPELPPVTSAYE